MQRKINVYYLGKVYFIFRCKVVYKYTALSFKVEVMMYCSLPDSLRIGYFFIIECQRVTLLLKSIFVIFGEENVKVW